MSAQSVSLNGSIEAVESYPLNPPTMLVDTVGTGITGATGNFRHHVSHT